MASMASMTGVCSDASSGYRSNSLEQAVIVVVPALWACFYPDFECFLSYTMKQVRTACVV